MYAIVEVGGMQFKVAKAETVRVPKLESKPGKKVDLNQVLMIVDGKTINIGTPVIANAIVKATVVNHFKDDKVLVFKKKRRKNYKVLRGHRQQVTELKIDNISIGKGAAKSLNESAKTKPAAVKKTTEPKDSKTDSANSGTKAKKSGETAEKKKTTVKKTTASAKAKKAPSKPSKKKEA